MCIVRAMPDNEERCHWAALHFHFVLSISRGHGLSYWIVTRYSARLEICAARTRKSRYANGSSGTTIRGYRVVPTNLTIIYGIFTKPWKHYRVAKGKGDRVCGFPYYSPSDAGPLFVPIDLDYGILERLVFLSLSPSSERSFDLHSTISSKEYHDRRLNIVLFCTRCQSVER